MRPPNIVARFKAQLAPRLKRLARKATRAGVPPSWLGYRWIRSEEVQRCVARLQALGESVASYRTIHPPTTTQNALPCNISSREELPAHRGWWQYAFRDVPERRSGETFIATLPDCTVVPYIDASGHSLFHDDFWVGILNRDERALDLREFHFREGHARVLREATETARYRRATWAIERVYHNYSHWFTAHLPKVLLLKARGELGPVLLPATRPSFIDDSLRLMGIDPHAFETFEPGVPIEVDELTVLGTDRFRPELLRLVRDACPIPEAEQPHRRVYISRAKAERRQLVNEDELWPLLEAAGFAHVFMEDLSFEAQVRLMRETAVVVAPHGAGLTNMMFCPPGTHVVEIADLSFPNPNFYAVAAAMGHHYWILNAEGLGDVHPLKKDLRIDPSRVEAVLQQLP